jgi:hypothetical protein
MAASGAQGRWGRPGRRDLHDLSDGADAPGDHGDAKVTMTQQIYSASSPIDPRRREDDVRHGLGRRRSTPISATAGIAPGRTAKGDVVVK